MLPPVVDTVVSSVGAVVPGEVLSVVTEIVVVAMVEAAVISSVLPPVVDTVVSSVGVVLPVVVP